MIEVSFQAWKAYRNAFFRANKLIMKNDKHKLEEQKLIRVFSNILAYERKRRPRRSLAPDWVLYRYGYQDGLFVFRQLYDDSSRWEQMSKDERMFVEAFLSVLEYAYEEKLGQFNYEPNVRRLVEQLRIIHRCSKYGNPVPRVPH